MNMNVSSKTELLKQLSIESSEREAKGQSFWWVFFLTALAFGGLGYFLGQYYHRDKNVIMTYENSVTSEKESMPTSPSMDVHEKKSIVHDDKSTSNQQSVLNASGYITARRMATVSSQIMGLIDVVDVEEGLFVRRGDILAKIDDTHASIALQLAKAKLDVLLAKKKSIEASLKEANSNFQRIKKNTFSSASEKTRVLSELERQKANLETANGDIKVAKLDIASREEHLKDHTIRAPFSGVVTVKNAQPGEIVAPSSAGGGFTRTGICTIVDMESLEIEVDINEAFIGRVKPGQAVVANLDAYPDWDIAASVIAIIPAADRSKATVRTRIKINDSDVRILPDMGVKVAFFAP